MFPTPTPGFVPPAAPAVGVGVGGATAAAAAAAAALAAGLPLLLGPAAGGAAAGAIGGALKGLGQLWGYFNGRDKPNKNNKLPNGIGVEWTGPSGKAGYTYEVSFKWPIRPDLQDDPPNDTPEITLTKTSTNVPGPFGGAYAYTTATRTEKGQWFYGVGTVENPAAGGYWDPNRQYYSAGQGALEVEVRQVGDPDPSPLPPPYAPAPPAIEPLPAPQTEPKPRPKAPPPLPQVPPDPAPLPPLAPPSPNPAPSPAKPAPAPSPAPAPAIPGAKPMQPDGSYPRQGRPFPKPTDPGKHYNRGVGFGGNKYGPTNFQQALRELGRIEQKLAYIMDGGRRPPSGQPSPEDWFNIISKFLEVWFSFLPDTTYYLHEKCEPCEDDCAPKYETDTTNGDNYAFRGLAYRIDKIAELLDAQLGVKQLVCDSTPPNGEGDWVTIRFESDAHSEMGNRPLRKLFRYRTLSGKSLGQLSSYWSSFTWTAGPVCVKHKGAPWGYPQCWAESADEGKRVIRFAAAESGFDPDQVGKWEIGFSRNPRYGQRGSMRVKSIEGFPAVTSRDGPDGLPLVANPEI